MTTVADDRPADAAPTPRPVQDEDGPGRAWLVAALAAAAVAGALAGLLAVGPTPVLAVLLPLVLVPVVVWKRPSAGVVLLFAGIVVLEQFHYLVGDVRDGTFTSHIPFVAHRRRRHLRAARRGPLRPGAPGLEHAGAARRDPPGPLDAAC